MSMHSYNIRKRVAAFTDRTATPITAGEIRALLDEMDTLERKHDHARRDIGELRHAASHALDCTSCKDCKRLLEAAMKVTCGD